MNKEIYKSILDNSPIGYAYHKAIMDESGKPYDYEILDVNPAIENMIGFQAKDVVGSRVTQILPDIRKGTVDWIAYFGELSLKGGSREFTHYWHKTKNGFGFEHILRKNIISSSF